MEESGSGRAPRVFVSYAWEDEDYRRWVEGLARSLRRDGVDARLDAWDQAPGEDFVAFMNTQVGRADRILVVGSPGYRARVQTHEAGEAESGIGWEAGLLAAQVFRGDRHKLVFAVGRGPRLDALPDAYLTRPAYLLDGPQAEAHYARLLEDLLGRRAKSPPLGPPPASWQEPAVPVFARPTRGALAAGGLSEPPRASELPEARSTGHFVHAKLSAGGLLDLEPAHLPYATAADPTDDEGPAEPRWIHSFLVLPFAQYLRSSKILPYTPAAAICTHDIVEVHERVRDGLGPDDLRALSKAPSKLHREQKARLVGAMAEILRDSLVVGVTLPRLVVHVGRSRPELAYNVFLDVLLLPLLQVHERIGVRRFHLSVLPVRDDKREAAVLRASKRLVRASFRRSGAAAVDVVDDAGEASALLGLARLYAWLIGALHNNDDERWIGLLRAGRGG